MIISLIAAISQNRVIGKNGKMPWNLPEELKYFQEKTLGHFVLVGRKTYEILPDLPQRIIIVVSREKDITRENKGVLEVKSISEGINLAAVKGEEELFVIGGDSIFQQTIGIADRLYLTVIEKSFEGDAFFPSIDYGKWYQKKQSNLHNENGLKYSFKVFERRIFRQKKEMDA